MRLIDANTLKAEFTGNFQSEYSTAEIHALIDLAPTVGGWISVKDRLPDLSHTIVYADDVWLESDRVIVITPDEVTIGYLEDDGPEPVWQNPDIGEIQVSYWMPLPDMPKEK